jgi:hypothetical protein
MTTQKSAGVLSGVVVELSSETNTVKVWTDADGLPELHALPFLGAVVVMRADDWQHTVDVMQSGTSRLIALELERAQLIDDVQRLGTELATMTAANVELSARLSAQEDDGIEEWECNSNE